MDEWKIVMDPKECGYGIYQEKILVILQDPEHFTTMKRELDDRSVEYAELPEGVSMKDFPYYLCFWIPVTDPKDILLKDIYRGNVRKKISV